MKGAFFVKTFEDLLEAQDKQEFVRQAIAEYRSSAEYKQAYIGYEYYKRKNITIKQYQKLLYTLSGQAVPDNYSANYKFCNNFFQIFVKQEVSHLLGNGIYFTDSETKDKLGGALFDNQIYRSALAAIWGGVSYNFFNFDHIDTFKATEFVPFFGEEDGALHAGIRFWQVNPNKPIRATLYEEDGYTEYKYKDSECIVLQEKTPYILNIKKSDISGIEILDGKNYPSFPIVPLWANEEHQSEFEGLREKIDGYDLIQSGFANDLDDASQIYWTITNAGGMDDIDLAKFVERMKTVKAAVVDEQGSSAQAHTLEVPFEARTRGLAELRDSLYRDAMALDTDKISAGNITATAIEASYENLALKCDAFEMCVTDCIKAILTLAGIEDDPTYKRSKIINMQEDTEMILSAATVLDTETVLKHLPFLSPDEIEEILTRITREEANRYVLQPTNQDGREKAEIDISSNENNNGDSENP